MIYKRLVLACALLVTVAFTINSSAFAATPWAANASGTNPRFGWSSGQHVTLPDTSAHGTPTVTPDGFFFLNALNDMHFRAEAGGKATVNAGVSVRVNIASATPPNTTAIPFITIREVGTWGGQLPIPAVTADFDITDYGSATNTGGIGLPPAIFESDGTWHTEFTFVPGPDNGLGGVWLNPNVLQYFQIRVRNLIGAGSVSGTFIQKTGLEIIVPEPSSMLLMLTVLPLVCRRAHRR